jgi:hypothetical protein
MQLLLLYPHKVEIAGRMEIIVLCPRRTMRRNVPDRLQSSIYTTGDDIYKICTPAGYRGDNFSTYPYL